MGMFDDIRCKYPLPVEGANDLEYQTKDTPSQLMDLYEIREDGTLWEEQYEIEDKSDPNATGFRRVAGMMTRVNKRWEQVTDFTGEIDFYTSVGQNGWLEWSAYFVDGTIKQLQLIENRQAVPVPPALVE